MKNRTLRALLCAIVLLLPSALLAAGWDFIHPEFNANNLNGVATVSATEAFAVGDAGTILRYDGDRWQPELVATHANLTDVWAASATDVFVVGNDILSGDGIVFHYDGTKWEQIFSENGTQLSRVWGSSGTDVFALGYAPANVQPLVFHYNGGEWDVWADWELALEGIILFQIWGLSSTEVFAVGSDGSMYTYVYQYDGTEWTQVSSHYGEFYPNDIWGSSASDRYDLYMVGEDFDGNGKMLHYDSGSGFPPGSEWQPVTIDGGWNFALMGMWGTSASDIFVVSQISPLTGLAVIYHYDGTTWSERHNIDNIGFLAIQGSSASDVVAVGSTGVLAHYDGTQWEDVFKSDWTYNLSGVWGFSESDVFLVGDDRMGRRGVILHYDGKDFDVQLSVDNISFGQVWGPSNKDLFATGYDDERQRSVVYHYDGHGRGWTEQYVTDVDDTLVGLWGTSGTDVFAVGRTMREAQENTYGKIYHYDGVTWSLQYTLDEPYTFLNSVWGTSGSNVFAVGGYDKYLGQGGVEYRGYIYHYDGSTWVKQYGVEHPTFANIWGSSASDIFVVGHDNYTGRGTFFHYDGTSWQPQYETPANMGEIFMLSVGGASASDVYAAGYIRSVTGLFHYDGEAWSLVPDGVFSPVLAGIWAASANDVFVVGTSGTVLHYDGNSLVEPAPDQASGVTLDKVQTASVHLSCEELRARYGTPFLFRPVDDLLSFSASVSPDDDGQVGTFRYRVTGVNAPVRNLTLYNLHIDGESLPFEYAGAANTFQNGMWWITDEDGGYLNTREVLLKKQSYFVNFAIQDNGPGGYDLSDEPGTIEDTLVLGTHKGCAQKP